MDVGRVDELHGSPFSVPHISERPRASLLQPAPLRPVRLEPPAITRPRKPFRAGSVSNSIRQLGQKPPRMASLAKPISTVAVIVVVACESNYVTKG